MMAHFKPEIGALIRPSEAVEGVAESAACEVQNFSGNDRGSAEGDGGETTK